ncbi:rap1 GTPase-activating protein 2 isoform X2 [Denticeps clupeoides]|uniref:rap1 GTPase-activating protein 2 isoform X2 n=1 Tax=Denticeps clupeoides TaxID=299321 RepID=UPI0010A591D1|nr:rap1 GTPase-activating protein 2-like isoform X2 [Denticeps clupeoides]
MCVKHTYNREGSTERLKVKDAGGRRGRRDIKGERGKNRLITLANTLPLPEKVPHIHTNQHTGMDKEKRTDKLFSRKRSFTFGAYGGVDKFICENETRQESLEHSILDIMDSPTSEPKPVVPAPSSQKVSELFEVIAKLQGSRLDEQRCEFPPKLKLKLGEMLPLILPPRSGGYWTDPPLQRCAATSPTLSQQALSLESYDIMERDSEAKIYQQYFRHRYHHSFTALDSALGPLILSVCIEEEEKRLRVILRMKECSLHGTFSLLLFQQLPTAVELAKMLCENVTISRFETVCYLKAPELITAFDEHRVSQNFKFGVLYQKEGQITEADILSNNEESEEFLEFLSVLGQTVKLQGFTGFRGGLDVCHGQTGCEAVFTSFHGREIMFHVATKLPFTDGDAQQLQRKRHIGNDIVALVYQEGHTPFISDVITSHFLHCFIAVRRTKAGNLDDGGAFQVSVTARADVPPFGPPLPVPPIFTEGSILREFLLTKLINAEISCYKAERFSRLELRTRLSLLEGLYSELSTHSQCMLGEHPTSSLSLSESGKGVPEGGGGFIENFKRAIRVRSHSFDTLGVPKKSNQAGGAQKLNTSDKEGESDPSNSKTSGPAHLLNNPVYSEFKGQSSPQEEE